jgi:hypothetical protein
LPAYEGIADFLLLDSHRASDQIGALGVTHDCTISRRIVELVRTSVILAGGPGPDVAARIVDKNLGSRAIDAGHRPIRHRRPSQSSALVSPEYRRRPTPHAGWSGLVPAHWRAVRPPAISFLDSVQQTRRAIPELESPRSHGFVVKVECRSSRASQIIAQLERSQKQNRGHVS